MEVLAGNVSLAIVTVLLDDSSMLNILRLIAGTAALHVGDTRKLYRGCIMCVYTYQVCSMCIAVHQNSRCRYPIMQR